MLKSKFYTLKELILKYKDIDENYDIYILNHNELSLNSECVLIDNGIEDDIKYKYLMGQYTLFDILLNLQSQKENYDLDDAIAAIVYYVSNDSFMEVS